MTDKTLIAPEELKQPLIADSIEIIDIMADGVFEHLMPGMPLTDEDRPYYRGTLGAAVKALTDAGWAITRREQLQELNMLLDDCELLGATFEDLSRMKSIVKAMLAEGEG